VIRQALLVGFLVFTAAAASRFVEATYGEGGRQPPRLAPASLPDAHRARVVVREGIPVVRLSGSHRDVGRQYGAIFREQIRFLREEYFEPLPVAVLGRDAIRAWAEAVEAYIPEPYREEMRGMAETAGLTYEEVLQVNTCVDRLQSVMCSTIAVSGDAAKDGEVIFGRNLDFPGRGVLHRTSVVVVFAPEGKTPVASVTWPGLLGVLSGINAEGVAGATMMIHRRESELRPGVPYMLMYREALHGAKRASDVFDAIAASRRTCPNNFMAVDASGAAEVTEFDADRAVRRAAEHGCLCSTNFFQSAELADAGYPVGKRRHESLERFVRARRGTIDVEAVRAALADVAVPWFLNVQSMIFLPRARALHLSAGGALPAAKQPFIFLDADLLFGGAAADR
jgi:isopenicillin-N N-acyltransferase-like protein